MIDKEVHSFVGYDFRILKMDIDNREGLNLILI